MVKKRIVRGGTRISAWTGPDPRTTHSPSARLLPPPAWNRSGCWMCAESPPDSCPWSYWPRFCSRRPGDPSCLDSWPPGSAQTACPGRPWEIHCPTDWYRPCACSYHRRCPDWPGDRFYGIRPSGEPRKAKQTTSDQSQSINQSMDRSINEWITRSIKQSTHSQYERTNLRQSINQAQESITDLFQNRTRHHGQGNFFILILRVLSDAQVIQHIFYRPRELKNGHEWGRTMSSRLQD